MIVASADAEGWRARLDSPRRLSLLTFTSADAESPTARELIEAAIEEDTRRHEAILEGNVDVLEGIAAWRVELLLKTCRRHPTKS